MNAILSLAVSGLAAAQKRFAVRAENIVNVNTPGYRAQEPRQIDTGHGPAVVVSQSSPDKSADLPGPPAAGLDFLGNDVDLAEEFVDIMRTRHAFAASAQVIKTQDELARGFLDIFA